MLINCWFPTSFIAIQKPWSYNVDTRTIQDRQLRVSLRTHLFYNHRQDDDGKISKGHGVSVSRIEFCAFPVSAFVKMRILSYARIVLLSRVPANIHHWVNFLLQARGVLFRPSRATTDSGSSMDAHIRVWIRIWDLFFFLFILRVALAIVTCCRLVILESASEEAVLELSLHWHPPSPLADAFLSLACSV